MPPQVQDRAARPSKGRFDLGALDAEALLAEAARHRGQSLWSDARRQLRENRAAFASLLFLLALCVVAFLAPLLPLPSPIALDLQDEPQEPTPPWVALGDAGWDHRIVVRFDASSPPGMPLEFNEPARQACEELFQSLLGAAAGETPPAEWGFEDAEASASFALPFREALLEGERLKNELGAALTDALGERGGLLVESGATLQLGLGAVVPRDGYWALGPIDRALLALRYRCFGFAQAGHWLGTDAKGRDLLARIVWGSRVSLQVALAAALCSLLIGVTYGSLAGYVGGRLDTLMMRFVDVLYSIPFIFVVIFLITVINEYRTELSRYGIEYITVFYFVVGAIYWLTMARVVRGQVLQLRRSEFIEAARCMGASLPRILFQHIVPNVLSIVIVYLTLTIPAVMLFEAFLSFLGLGVEAPRVSWGLLAVDSTEAINPMRTYWWLVAFPAAAMGTTLLALNVLGDGLRDALDPKLRGSA